MDDRPGFDPEELKLRYDVEAFREDAWHTYCGRRTANIVAEGLLRSVAKSRTLLNAGSGVHRIEAPGWEEVSVDLFAAPLRLHSRSVRANVEQLPFKNSEFGAVVCVGEVLGYCDPAKAIVEFSRVLERGGILICDFGNSRSIRYWFTSTFRRSADLVTDAYNGSPERIWVYDPSYILSVANTCGLRVLQMTGTHSWSAVARRVGVGPDGAVWWEKALNRIPAPNSWAALTTIVACRHEGAPK